MTDWETLRFKLRETSKKVDYAIKELCRISVQISKQGKSSSFSSEEGSLFEIADDLGVDFKRARLDQDQILSEIRKVVNRSDSARMAQIQKREWERQWSTVDSERMKRELFGSRGSGDSPSSANPANTLLHERGSLVQSMGMMDMTIDNAMSAHGMLREQNSALLTMTGKLGGLTSKVPFINTLLGKINNRQFQERLILALVVGVCISILIWMRLLR